MGYFSELALENETAYMAEHPSFDTMLSWRLEELNARYHTLRASDKASCFGEDRYTDEELFALPIELIETLSDASRAIGLLTRRLRETEREEKDGFEYVEPYQLSFFESDSVFWQPEMVA